jgi:predicted DNA-binding antitoxin AbrB/MazE fold protein
VIDQSPRHWIPEGVARPKRRTDLRRGETVKICLGGVWLTYSKKKKNKKKKIISGSQKKKKKRSIWGVPIISVTK